MDTMRSVCRACTYLAYETYLDLGAFLGAGAPAAAFTTAAFPAAAFPAAAFQAAAFPAAAFPAAAFPAAAFSFATAACNSWSACVSARQHNARHHH